MFWSLSITLLCPGLFSSDRQQASCEKRVDCQPTLKWGLTLRDPLLPPPQSEIVPKSPYELLLSRYLYNPPQVLLRIHHQSCSKSISKSWSYRGCQWRYQLCCRTQVYTPDHDLHAKLLNPRKNRSWKGSEPNKRKRKHHKSSHSSKSSRQSKSHFDKKKVNTAAEKAYEVENLKLIRELTD
ncbi:UNVERIFIED_CONTAM: hypothetical protein Sradi_1550000 [Sesamum radiatum]|uniref:Uncharacterized protein n=1 Tax=Sesamum radiatum TaxID=300843 RepID=A0AAW2U986_SESRA